MILGGITQQVGASWHLAANVWRTIQDGKAQSQDGSAWQYQVVADYDLSKRTDIYLETDYSRYKGGLIGAQLQGVNAPGLAQKKHATRRDGRPAPPLLKILNDQPAPGSKLARATWPVFAFFAQTYAAFRSRSRERRGSRSA
jgi:hypothetical protein